MTASIQRDAVTGDRALPTAVPGIRQVADAGTADDFIPPPAQFPLRCRRRLRLPWQHSQHGGGGDVGLRFVSPAYLPPGSPVELEIPLRGTRQRFRATVVLVRETRAGFEIGVWFADADDAARARLVEHICRTECYLRDRPRARGH